MIYLATPYSSSNPREVESRFNQACEIAGSLMQQGEIVFCPIAHMHPIAIRCELPKGWQFWGKFDREFIRLSSKLIVAEMSGWEASVGVQAEIKLAQELGIPVEYMKVKGQNYFGPSPYLAP